MALRGTPRGLIYHAGGLGDFVLSLPAVYRYVQTFPQAEWFFWGPRDRLALLPAFRPAPVEILRQEHTLWGNDPDPDAVGALAGFDAVLAFGGRKSPPWIAHCRNRVAAVASFPPAGGIRVPVFQMRQLDVLGVPRLREPWLPDWRRRVLPARQPHDVVLHPGSGDPRKNFPVSAWIEVLDRVRSEITCSVRLVLGAAEIERRGWHPLTSRVSDVVACGSLQDLLDVFSRARLFLGNDSGVAHLAGILAVPTVAVFGPSDPRIWKPLGPWVRPVAVAMACAPCTAGGVIRCDHSGCLQDLPAGRVASVAVDLWSASEGGPGGGR